MTSFRNRVFTLGTAICLVMSLGCSSDSDYGDEYAQYDDSDYGQVQDGNYGQQIPADGGYRQQSMGAPPQSGSQGGNVITVMDHGLGMPLLTMTLPPGWGVNQNIATDPNSGQTRSFILDRFGPEGELLRATAPTTYLAPNGQNFQQMWRQTAHRALQGVIENVSFGSLQPSETLRRFPSFQKVAQQFPTEPLEASIRGMRQGQPFAGLIYILRMQIPNAPQSGVFALEVLVCPEPLVGKTIQTYIAMAHSERPNPQHEARMMQISTAAHNQRMASSQSQFNAHNQRMANRQSQFDAHQQRMQTQYQANDQANQQWMTNFRQPSGNAANNGYSGHDAFIDGIHEQQTFADPYSGQNQQQSGQYDYNYTDGLGNYYRTDDPSFNSNSLQGNWQEVQPLQANPY